MFLLRLCFSCHACLHIGNWACVMEGNIRRQHQTSIMDLTWQDRTFDGFVYHNVVNKSSSRSIINYLDMGQQVWYGTNGSVSLFHQLCTPFLLRSFARSPVDFLLTFARFYFRAGCTWGKIGEIFELFPYLKIVCMKNKIFHKHLQEKKCKIKMYSILLVSFSRDFKSPTMFKAIILKYVYVYNLYRTWRSHIR